MLDNWLQGCLTSRTAAVSVLFGAATRANEGSDGASIKSHKSKSFVLRKLAKLRTEIGIASGLRYEGALFLTILGSPVQMD